MIHALDTLLAPRTVAIIGASDAPERIGGRPLHYLLKHGFKGDIYPVNPSRKTVQGVKAYASITDVPKTVDCAIIAVPAALVVDTVRACVAANVRSAILFSSGFAEVGEEGGAVQTKIQTIAAQGGMRLLGPNCLGVLNSSISWFGTFANGPAEVDIRAGGVTGIVTQSGAYGSHIYMTAQARRVGIRYWVTTGNEVDIDVAEVIEFYARSNDVKVIVAYIEGVKDGAGMRRALEAARRARKPVIIMKVGRSKIGAQAASTHTASVAGKDSVYDALFRQYGAFRATTMGEMVDLAYACQFGFFPQGRRMCLQSISGGAGIQMADVADEEALEVPPLPDDMQRKLKALIPHASVRNPVDFTANAVNDPELLPRNLDLTLSSGLFDGHVVYLTSVPGSPFTRTSCLEGFRRIRAAHPDAMILMSMLVHDDVAIEYEALGLPCFSDPVVAVRVMAALVRFRESFDSAESEDLLPVSVEDMPDLPNQLLSEYEAKKVLAECGLRIPRESLVLNADEGMRVAEEIGRPVALKIASPDIMHKTEIGGVLLNIVGSTAVAEGISTLFSRAKKAAPDARIEGILVSEMVPKGVEVIIGVTRDPIFGPVVMVGLGGVLVEVLRDVSFRLAPFGLAEARRMIAELRGAALLDGVRGAAPVDREALADALSRLSVFAHRNAERIESVDVNPLIVLPSGAVATDALFIPVASTDRPRH